VVTQERLIRWWINRYTPRMKTFSAADLYQEGYLALFRAALEYDPINRPYRFTTLACASLYHHYITVLKHDRAWLTGGPAHHPVRLPFFANDLRAKEVDIWDENSELREQFWILAAKLSERERMILRLRIDGETLRSIALAFDLSAERVRQIEKQAIRRMKKEWSRSA
jgi:RNA polymerase sigma factor (sigma-70 family)